MGCRREAPPTDVPRVYETAECAAVMRLPGMTPDEVARGVFSHGVLALDGWGLVTVTKLHVESIELAVFPGASPDR